MNVRRSSFNSGRLAIKLKQLPACHHYRIGFSGGADSTALLVSMSELAAQLGFALSALHFNHGLHQDSGKWENHCDEFCRRLEVPFECQHLEVDGQSGNGIEAEARQLRYEQVGQLLSNGEAFVTAHHMEDQAETLLLNLMRASGVDGLAGIPQSRNLGQGVLLRPLLEFPMASLREYLASKSLSWHEDPSNDDLAFDRNFIRHQVVPLLETRWPGAAVQISRSADYCRQASNMLDQASQMLFERHREPGPVLPFTALNPGSGHFSLLLRYWLKKSESPPIPANKVQEFERQLLESSQSANPEVEWQNWRIGSFGDKLWLQADDQPGMCPSIDWQVPGPLDINHSIGRLSFEDRPDLPVNKLMVDARRDGDRIQSKCGQHHRTVKNILREAGVPPWLRDSIPILRSGEQVLAVAGFSNSKDFDSWLRKHRTRLIWSPADPLLRFILATSEQHAVDHDLALR